VSWYGPRAGGLRSELAPERPRAHAGGPMQGHRRGARRERGGPRPSLEGRTRHGVHRRTGLRPLHAAANPRTGRRETSRSSPTDRPAAWPKPLIHPHARDVSIGNFQVNEPGELADIRPTHSSVLGRFRSPRSLIGVGFGALRVFRSLIRARPEDPVARLDVPAAFQALGRVAGCALKDRHRSPASPSPVVLTNARRAGFEPAT
jgi:hypothetical protein